MRGGDRDEGRREEKKNEARYRDTHTRLPFDLQSAGKIGNHHGGGINRQ